MLRNKTNKKQTQKNRRNNKHFMIFFSFDVKFRLFLTHSKKNRAKFQRLLQKVLWSIKSPFTTVSPCPSLLVGKRLITGILLPFNYKATFKHAKTPVFWNIRKNRLGQHVKKFRNTNWKIRSDDDDKS